jgi:mannose-6-phosphate isomerase-like protein (cupin superfamily)
MDNADDTFEAPEEHEKKEKPWGYERAVASFRGIFLKELFFRAGKISSLHFHETKDELFYIARGQVKVLLENREVRLGPGDIIHIRPGQRHRILPLRDTLILEVSSRLFGDVRRIEDPYNRPDRE